MKTTAAVLVETGKPLALARLDVPALQPGQVLVEIAFSGVCHTQVLECRGHRGEDPYLPHCLGHEGSGLVCDIGPAVTKVKAGDRVILSWVKGSGTDVPRTVYHWENRPVNAGGITTFSRHSVVSENRLTILPDDIAMREAVMLGCAVPTGVGAVVNIAQAEPGQSMAVFGSGGVGLCVIGGAAIAGCSPIIAVDIRRDRLDLARQVGATHCILAGELDPVEETKRLCSGGVDFAVECTGQPGIVEQCLRSVRNQGGAAIVIGNARYGERIVIDPREFNLGKSLLGAWGGDSWPDRDYPRYCKLVSSGQLDLASLAPRSYALHEINDAIDDLETGSVVRPVVDMAME